MGDITSSQRIASETTMLPDHLEIGQSRLFRAFSSRKRAREFLDGELYMSSIGSLWRGREFSEARALVAQAGPGGLEEPVKLSDRANAQRDAMEGAAITVSTEVFGRVMPDLAGHLLYEPRLVAYGYRYCNVLCFSRQKVFSQGRRLFAESPGNSDCLGDWLVVIDDPAEFVRRVADAAGEVGFHYIAGPVLYEGLVPTAPDVDGRHSALIVAEDPMPWDAFGVDAMPPFEGDSFVKTPLYANQMEWRICLYRGVAVEEPCFLSVGNLGDIAHAIQRKSLDEDLRRRGADRAGWIDGAYRGDVSRDEMRSLFFELGSRQVIPALVVG